LVSSGTARYEDGLLKPAQPLKLRQGEKVGVIVIRHPDPARWDLKRLAHGRSGLIRTIQAGIGAFG
jgi:predicted DNA-binding antitoxin AbrB/MazE fold protein